MQPSTVNIALGVGAAIGFGGGIAASVIGVRHENEAVAQADKDWASARPQRQGAIDHANAFVDDIVRQFDPNAHINADGGLHSVSIYDPNGAAAKYLGDHRDAIPANVTTDADTYSASRGTIHGDYVKLQVSDLTRPRVDVGNKYLAGTMIAGLAAAALGGAMLLGRHDLPGLGLAGGAVAAAGGGVALAGLLGNAAYPESAIPW